MNAPAYLFLLLCLFAFPVQASPPQDDELQRLTSNLQSAKTQSDMNFAARALAEYWDNRLAALEAKIQTKLDRKGRKKFGHCKRHWCAYRSDEVTFRASFFDGGCIQPLITSTAYAELTEHRVEELESLFSETLDGRAEPRRAPKTGSLYR